jgi:hypothetical protein
MASRSRLVLALVSGLAIGLGVALEPYTAVAAGTCSASFVVLGQIPNMTGPTSTDWFNVFGDDFEPGVTATVTFGVPVIPWSIEHLKEVQPAVTSFVVPAKDMAAGGFKWTFRARDSGVKTIDVQIAGSGCQATTVVDFSPPATSTAELSAPNEPTSFAAILLLLSFAGGLLAFWRRLDRPLDRPGRPGS